MSSNSSLQRHAKRKFVQIRINSASKASRPAYVKWLCIVGMALSCANLMRNAHRVQKSGVGVRPKAGKNRGRVYVSRSTNYTRDNSKSVALCAIVKSEEAYLQEWMDYHAALGVTHFFLYDNTWHPELLLQSQDFNVLNGANVTVRHWPGLGEQASAYRDCAVHLQHVQQKSSKTEQPHWVGFLDVDEFVVLKKHQTLTHFLWDHCPDGAVSLSWAMMGSSGRIAYSPQPVSQRFQYRTLQDSEDATSFKGQFDLVKTFARIEDIKPDGLFNAHFVTLKDGRHRVDTQGIIQNVHARRNPFFDETDEFALVYHYRSKSAVEYAEKFSKGRSGSRADNATWVAKQQRFGEKGRYWMQGDVRDSVVWESLTLHKPLYFVFDDFLGNVEPPKAAVTRSNSTPTGSNSTFGGAAICGSLSTGDSAYVDEWLDYHYQLGFEHFILWDNTTSLQMKQWGDEAATKYHDNNTVVVNKWTGWRASRSTDVQRRMQQDLCVKMAASEGYEWLAMLNIDQFLVLRNHSHVLDFVQSMALGSATGWRLDQFRFGTAGHRYYQPKPVTQRFQLRESAMDLSCPVPVLHVPTVKDMRTKEMNLGVASPPQSTDESGKPSAVVHHYATRSIKEHLLRECGIQSLSNETSMNDPYIQSVLKKNVLPKGSVHDGTAWEVLKKLNPRYSVYEKL